MICHASKKSNQTINGKYRCYNSKGNWNKIFKKTYNKTSSTCSCIIYRTILCHNLKGNWGSHMHPYFQFPTSKRCPLWGHDIPSVLQVVNCSLATTIATVTDQKGSEVANLNIQPRIVIVYPVTRNGTVYWCQHSGSHTISHGHLLEGTNSNWQVSVLQRESRSPWHGHGLATINIPRISSMSLQQSYLDLCMLSATNNEWVLQINNPGEF